MASKRGLMGWLLGGDKPDPAKPKPPPIPADALREPSLDSARASTDAISLRVSLLERFEHRGEIARGGMASIHHVVDRNLLRHSAMKVLAPELAAQPAHRTRFLEEAQITGQLDHPNICPVHDLGVDEEGALYFTMKLVKGESLEAWLKRDDGPRNVVMVARYIEVLCKVCDGLSFAHSRGVVHRDLKPANIMIGSHGQVYVMDWGLALLLGEQHGFGERDQRQIAVTRDRGRVDLDPDGVVAGSLGYMAPEQARGENRNVDERSDVFALGALLYHLCTGQPPYAQAGQRERLAAAQSCSYTLVDDMPLAENLPRRLGVIAQKAMAEDPDQRHQSAEEFKQDLQQYQRGGVDLPLRVYPPGSVIVRQGEDGKEAFLIKWGTCRAWKLVDGKRINMRTLEVGEVFGEASILSGRPRTATVEAVDEVTVMVVRAEELIEGIGVNPWLGMFVRALADRFYELDQLKFKSG
jgi:serine/threonine-protein kinase